MTRALILALLAATLAVTACGKKGNPIRPAPDTAQQQTDED